MDKIDVINETGSISLDKENFEYQAILNQKPGEGADRILVTNNILGVADGATALKGNADPGVFAGLILDALRDYAHMEGPALYREAMSWYPDLWQEGSMSEKVSCCFSLLNATEGNLFLNIIGDCSAIIETDEIKAYTDDRLNDLDALVADQMFEDIKNGMAYQEARDAAAPQLIKHRDLGNTPGGYWACDGNPEVADEILSFSFPIKKVRSALIFTDGLEKILHPFSLYSSEDLLKAVQKKGLSEVVQELRAAEIEDFEVKRYPRLAPADDIGAIYVEKSIK